MNVSLLKQDLVKEATRSSRTEWQQLVHHDVVWPMHPVVLRGEGVRCSWPYQ